MSSLQEVGYVDAQRNMAVTMGERDVKTDVKEKSKFVQLQFLFNTFVLETLQVDGLISKRGHDLQG